MTYNPTVFILIFIHLGSLGRKWRPHCVIEYGQVVISVAESECLFADLIRRVETLLSLCLISALRCQLHDLDQFRPDEVEFSDLLVDVLARGSESFFLGHLMGFGFALGSSLGGRLLRGFGSWGGGDIFWWEGVAVVVIPADGCNAALWGFFACGGVHVSVIWSWIAHVFMAL